MVVVILLCAACCLVGAWMGLRARRRRRVRAGGGGGGGGGGEEPPVMPGAWPLIGHAPLFTLDNIRIWELALQFSKSTFDLGGAATMFLGPRTVYVLTDPDDCCTAANACLEKAEFYEFARPWIGNGLISAKVVTWKNHRKLLTPSFSQHVLDDFLDVFNSQAERLADSLADQVGRDPFDHWPYLALNGLETICLTALGSKIGKEDKTINEQYFYALEETFNILIERITKIWLYSDRVYNWTRLKKRQDELIKVLHSMSNKELQKRKSELNNNAAPEGKFKPFLDLLLELANDKGVFTEQEIREHVDTMIVAGHDTSANSLLYTLLLLGSHPQVQDRVYKELQEIFQGSDCYAEKHHLSRLVYMEAVIKESLRLFPIFPVVTRRVERDVKLKKYTMRAGAICFLTLYGIHRHPVWGADADQFRPERWLEPAALPANPAAFAAFSIGRRACIGKTYAMMSMKTSLAHVLRRYKVSGDCSQLKLKMGVMLKPASGNHIRLERR